MARRALITGIAGQDGSYLAELLLEKGYEVHGIELPVGSEQGHHGNITHLQDRIHLHFGSVADEAFLSALVETVLPEECYHLAASSFVSYALEDEASILQNNVQTTHLLLGILKEKAPACRLFFAGTSEMFGQVESAPQDENTPYRPRSIYGISKVAGHHLVSYYRQKHNLFACTGILYNHESPRRGKQFVTRKISEAAARIRLGLERKLFLGNLEALRDWGYAPDYVRAMWLMLQQNDPEDFVISTGMVHSVGQFVDKAFRVVGLDYRNHVELDPTFFREAERIPLCGNPEKALAHLGWQNTKDFEEIVAEMVEHDLSLCA